MTLSDLLSTGGIQYLTPKVILILPIAAVVFVG